MPTPLRLLQRSVLALLAGLLAAPHAGAQAPSVAPAAAPARALLWSVADADSRLFLLGSVHALPAGTDVLPGPAADAFAGAEALAFEVDLDLAPAAASAAVSRALAADGLTLSKRLGPRDTARLRVRLREAGLDLDAADAFEPWFVALLIGNAVGGATGYSAAAGVDVQLFARAGVEGKARLGLETIDDQIGALDGLPMKDQLALLRSALDDDESGDGLAGLVAAWQAGDADALAALIADGLGTTVALRQRVLTDRNARWVPQIEAFLARTGPDGVPEDVLVVVGAGHLVGPGSVVEMLRARGLDVVRVE